MTTAPSTTTTTAAAPALRVDDHGADHRARGADDRLGDDRLGDDRRGDDRAGHGRHNGYHRGDDGLRHDVGDDHGGDR